jgi:hypothetical protein
MSSKESNRSSEDPEKEDWKDMKVANSSYTYKQLADQVVKAHNDLEAERNEPNSYAKGIQNAEEELRRIHGLLHAHEKRMIQQNRLTENQRKKGQWHHKPQWWNPLGNRIIHNPGGDTQAGPLHLRGGKKKRKTKRKKTKRKKRKTKRRKKTRKHKRRKRRKTRKR